MTTPADFRELRDRLENEFASLLAPDLKANGADRVHIVIASETDLTTCGEFAGLTSPHIHRWLRSYVPRWNGPSPAMLIDDATILRDCGTWWNVESRFVAIAAHELSHIVCTPGLYARDDEQPDPPDDGSQRLFSQSLANREAVHSPALSDMSPRRHHEWPFLRACLHIRHRLELRGIECLMPMMLDSGFYALSPLASYRRSLGDEPARLESLTMTMIKHIDPPKLFSDLWIADVTNWPDV